MVLCSQLSDWEKFREYQGGVRLYYSQRNSLPDFQDKVRDRRRRHRLESDVCLRPDPEQQTQLENWIEFQNYHLHIDEGFHEYVKDRRGKLDAARKKLETGTSGPTGAEDVEIFSKKVQYFEAKLRKHQILLRWIEQKRVAFAAQQALSVDASPTQDDRSQAEEDEPSAIRRRPASARRKGAKKTPSVLSPVRSAVSKKPRRRRRNLWPRKLDSPQSAEKATTAESKAPRYSNRIRDIGGNKPHRNKESTPLRPLHPQRVSKSAKKSSPSEPSATVNTKSR